MFFFEVSKDMKGIKKKYVYIFVGKVGERKKKEKTIIMVGEVAMEKNKKVRRENKFERSHFDVLGICCSSEVPLIENILKPLEGIKQISVIVPTRTLIVVHDSLLVSQLQIGTLLSFHLLIDNICLNQLNYV